MGNLLFQPSAKSEKVIELEFGQSTPIVGIPIKPTVNLKVVAPVQFLWYSVDQMNLKKTLIGQNIEYKPIERDIGNKLEFQCKLYSNSGDPIVKVIETEPTISFPTVDQDRFVLSIEKPESDGPKDYFGTTLFRIVNYNITDQERIENYKEYLPTYAVQWIYRRNVINSEILSLEGDIICLQEIPTKHQKEFELEYSKCGFSSYIPEKSKANEFPLINGIFFRRVKFHLIKSWLIDFEDAVPKIFSRVKMKENNFGLIVLLEFKDTIKGASERVLIANAQFSTEQSFYEAVVFINSLEDIRKKEQPKDSIYTLPIVICCDFKSDSYSSAYEYIETGSVLSSVHEHQTTLKDAYKTGFGKILSYKLQNDKVLNLNNYIFYSNDIYLTQVMDLNENEKFPNELKCSDHVSIYSEFDVKK
eukprot:gene10375-2904_t